jgi:hypothetical protein
MNFSFLEVFSNFFQTYKTTMPNEENRKFYEQRISDFKETLFWLYDREDDEAQRLV